MYIKVQVKVKLFTFEIGQKLSFFGNINCKL